MAVQKFVPLGLLTVAMLGLPCDGAAAQKAFFVFQSPGTETVPAGLTTNFTVTLTYSNASGTINNAVFTNGVSVVAPGQGVTAALNSIYAGPINSGGGTTNLTLTISAASNTPANTSYQIIVSTTNSAFTANTNPPGVASLTNIFIVGPVANSNAFSIALSPSVASCRAGAATNFTATATFVDYSSTISGTITNGVLVSGPDLVNVTASLNSPYAAVTNNFGQTNLTLSINVSSNAANGTYTITVKGTNAAFTANPSPGVASAAFTLNLTLLKKFTVGLTPSAETVTEGAANEVTVAVTLTNLSDALVETITNGVTVIGPDPANNVMAGLSSAYVSPPARGGTATFTLRITKNSNSAPGAYQVIVSAANSDYTDNVPTPGIALATNIFSVNVEPFSIQNFSLAGSNLAVTGIGGGPDWQFLVYASTNLTLPLPQWTPILTNLYDTNGKFSVLIPLTITLSSDAAQQFLALSFPASTNPVATPSFSPPAGPYYAETTVTIASATSNAVIRYTTDGSTPSQNHGAIYSGPVTMHQPVNTNRSGLVTNASGVTMLKAIAYKGGMLDSAVWAGIYSILNLVDYPPAPVPSPLRGIAHIAYNVSSSNWVNTLSLWTNYYGLAPMMVSNNLALIKINDQQYIELNQVPLLVSNQWQLANFGFEVTNAEIYRELLATNGVSVPPAVTTNALGNLSFFTVDPDGHTNEWVQYLTNSVTGLSQGRYMPNTILAGYANDVGIATTDETLTLPRNYYGNQCGFQGSGNQLYVPSGGKCYIELLTTGPSGATQAIEGKHGKIQFLNFRGMDLFQTLNILTNRNSSIPFTISVEGTTLQHYAFDVYDLDLSRIRINDE